MITKQATFKLPEHELIQLKDMAISEGVTTTAMLRRAIKAELFLSECFNRGDKLLIEHKDGTKSSVIRV